MTEVIKMIPSPKGKDFQAKQEGESKVSPRAAASSSSRQWSAFRNPRIVRVSRSFGGKDRHSKVCTVRGLRDRRIRLSVPTAIQLYDLQDRLRLNQPSKVIDWLLDATKNDIDNLPPLQMPEGFGAQFHQPMLVNSHESSHAPSQSSLSPFFDANSLEKGKWIKTNEQENLNIFPLASSHSSMPGLVNNPLPFNPHYHWDASNLSLSQFGSHGFLSQNENSINNNIPSSQLALSSSGSQLFFCPPPAATMPSLSPAYPPYVTTAVENDHHWRELNHFQLLTPSSQHTLPSSRVMSSPTKPFQLINVSPGLLHLQGNEKRNAGHQDDTDS